MKSIAKPQRKWPLFRCHGNVTDLVRRMALSWWAIPWCLLLVEPSAGLITCCQWQKLLRERSALWLISRLGCKQNNKFCGLCSVFREIVTDKYIFYVIYVNYVFIDLWIHWCIHSTSIFNHLRSWIAVAKHNLKWLKIQINWGSD